MIKRLVWLFVLSFVSSFMIHNQARSEPIDPNEILQRYQSLTQVDQSFFEQAILPSIQEAFEDVLTDPETGLDRSIMAKRFSFYNLYRELTEELSHQHKSPFRQYDHFTKISRSTLRLIMHAMATDTESIFYGIHDDVYDDLFATHEGPLPGFQQLTYEPLLRNVNGLQVAVPLAMVATALVVRILPGRRAKIVAAALGGILTIAGLSGCTSPSTPDDNDDDDSLQDIFLFISTKWQAVEENIQQFQGRMLDSVEPTVQTIFAQNRSEIVFTESIKRQFYAAGFETVVDYLIRYLKDEDFQDAENEKWRQEHGDETSEDEGEGTIDDGELEGDFPEDDDEGDIPTDGTVESLQEKVIWSKFLSLAEHYMHDADLLNLFKVMNPDQRRFVLQYLFVTYSDYDEVWEANEQHVASIRVASEKIGLPFEEEDRKDKIALKKYIDDLMDWIASAEGGGSSEENPIPDSLQYQILSDLEKELLENLSLERLQDLQALFESDE